MLPKLILTDIDGVWTDGGMYYDNFDNEFKKFNTSDSAGILFCRLLDIKVGIITGENSPAVLRRSEKLKIDILHIGVKDKLGLAMQICKEQNISLSQVAYIGDDINDFELLGQVGFSACPSTSPFYIKEIVNAVMTKGGGEGCFREFVEYIIGTEGIQKALNQYLKNRKFTQ